MTIKPYRLDLKKLSREYYRLLKAVSSLLPDTGAREAFADSVTDSLAEETGEKVSLRIESVSAKVFSEFTAALPQHALVAVFGYGGAGARIVCEIDFTLAALVVERVLGGGGSTLPELRRLSDTELGVVQYLLARILDRLHNLCGKAERAHLRIERLGLGQEELRGAVDESAECAVLACRVGMGRHAGFARIVFPNPFSEEALLDTVSPGESMHDETALLMERLGRYSYVLTTVWAEAGRTTLLPADISQLEPGDVLLLDNGDIALSGGTAGRAVLRAGTGLSAGFDVRVELGGSRVRAGITGIHRGD